MKRSTSTLTFGAQSDLSVFTETMVEMTWQEVEASALGGDIVLFPIGVVEEHGPHMDLSPDFYLAYLNCRFLKQSLEAKGIQAIIAPPYYWGICEDVSKYPGTFSVRPETLKAMLIDIFSSLNAWKFKNVFVINAHGDRLHVQTIEEAIKEANESLNIQVYGMWNLDVQLETPPIFPVARAGRFEPDYHAGAIETAAMATFYPQKVNAELAKSLKPQDNFHPLGYCGDPASFELEKDVIEFTKADVELDTLKIKAILRKE